MPNLPKPRFGRPVRGRGRVAGPPEAEAEAPNVELVEAEGLRWIHIERPRPADRTWLEEHFEFHHLDYEDIYSRNQRPKVDEYDDYLFVVLHFPRFDKAVGRLNAAELDIFVGPDFVITLPNEPIQPLEYLFERCKTREDVRDSLFAKGPGYLLYKIVDDCVDASFPMLAKMGNKLERPRGRDLGGPLGRDRARHLQRQAGDHQLPQDRPPAARGAAGPRAHEALHPRGAGHLLRRHQRRVGAHLGHARELQGGRRGPRVDERVGVVAPRQRHPQGADGDQRRRPAADARREHLRHERARAGRGVAEPRSGSSSASMVALLAGMLWFFRNRGWL